MKNLKIGMALFLLLLILTVVIQNTGGVHLRFLAWKVQMSLVQVISLTFLAGFGFGLLTAAIFRVTRKRPQ